METAAFAKARRCACGNIRRATRALTHFYDSQLRPSGLTAAQFSLLVNISLRESVTVGQLADLLLMDQTTVTRTTDHLRRAGYIIAARQHGDARKKHLTLTAAGRAALTAAMPLWEEAQARIEAGVGEERYRDLLKTLAHISALTK